MGSKATKISLLFALHLFCWSRFESGSLQQLAREAPVEGLVGFGWLKWGFP